MKCFCGNFLLLLLLLLKAFSATTPAKSVAKAPPKIAFVLLSSAIYKLQTFVINLCNKVLTPHEQNPIKSELMTNNHLNLHDESLRKSFLHSSL